ncbi:MAG TPA: hypothetical protein VFN28_09120 [Amaricoccus sp.]|nr:hypothetical protein [Amaricoccus sp.]
MRDEQGAAGRRGGGRSDFVVFCDARTGSYNLTSLLDSADDVVCHGEIFKKTRIEVSDFHRRRLGTRTLAERNHDAAAFIAELRRINPFKHFGYKMFASHLGWAPGAVEYLTAPATCRVILVRPGLEVYASGLRARETGVWTHREDRKISEKTLDRRVEFTPESFETFCSHYNRYVAMCHMLAALPGSFVIHYEQTNDPEVLDALLGFIGSKARASDLRSDYRKQYKGTLADGFSNWEALRATMGSLTPLGDGPAPTIPLRQLQPAG